MIYFIGVVYNNETHSLIFTLGEESPESFTSKSGQTWYCHGISTSQKFSARMPAEEAVALMQSVLLIKSFTPVTIETDLRGNIKSITAIAD